MKSTWVAVGWGDAALTLWGRAGALGAGGGVGWGAILPVSDCGVIRCLSWVDECTCSGKLYSPTQVEFLFHSQGTWIGLPIIPPIPASNDLPMPGIVGFVCFVHHCCTPGSQPRCSINTFGMNECLWGQTANSLRAETSDFVLQIVPSSKHSTWHIVQAQGTVLDK